MIARSFAFWLMKIRIVTLGRRSQCRFDCGCAKLRSGQASRILSGDLEAQPQLDGEMDAESSSADMLEVSRGDSDNNPWELLVVAFLFLVPGLCVFQTKYPVVATISSRIQREIAAVTIIHFLGCLAIGFADFLIATYFRVWRSSPKLQN